MQVDNAHTRSRSMRQRTRLTCSLYDVVVAGDTCERLVAFNNISLSTFRDLNPGLDCTQLHVGMSACVGQEVASAVPYLACGLMYRRQGADTCESMRKANLLTHAMFQKLNRGMQCDNSGVHEVCQGSAALRAHSLPPLHSCCRL